MIENQLDDLIGAVNALNDTLFEIKQDVARLTGTSLTPETPTEDSKPARPAPKKQTPTAGESASPAAGEEPVEQAAGPAESAAESAPTDQPSREDVVAELKALDQAKGKTAVRDLLAKFEARNLSTLGEDKYAEVVAAARAAA